MNIEKVLNATATSVTHDGIVAVNRNKCCSQAWAPTHQVHISSTSANVPVCWEDDFATILIE